jgi:hypothetical protein
MKLQVTMEAGDSPDDAQRAIAAIEAFAGLTTVNLRIGSDAAAALTRAAGRANTDDAPDYGKNGDTDAAGIGFGTGASGEVSGNTDAPVNNAGGVELDSTGLPWDARIHSGAKSKNKDGRWKAKKGVHESEVTRVEAELRSVMGANVAAAPAPIAEPAVPAPPAPPAPPAAEVPPPPQAVTPPPPPATTPAPPAATDAPTTFAALMGWIGPRMAAKKLTPDVVAATVASVGVMDANGVGQLTLLAHRPDAVPAVYDALRAITGE